MADLQTITGQAAPSRSSTDKAPPPLSVDTSATPSVVERPYSRSSTPSSPMARPPTPGGGPLSSHPATPVPTNDRFSPPPQPETQEQENIEPKKADSVTATTSLEQTTPTKPPKSIPVTEAASAIASAGNSRPPSSHLKSPPPSNTTPIKTGVPARKPLTPASANASKPLNRRNSTGVRKLLSLTSLRSSFSSSRTSLVNQPSPDTKTTAPLSKTASPTTKSTVSPSNKRPSSPSISSTLSPTNTGTWQTYTASVSGGGTTTPSSAVSPSDNTTGGGSPRLRKRKSGNWFRRASMMMRGDEGLENVPEGRENYTTAKSGFGGMSEVREMSSAGSGDSRRDPRSPGVPVLPEIKALTSPSRERWGEDMFAGVGR
ncbi:hypothetical protein C1H76_7611 [Elsinoe australis]|uniref:Uncharacterized protein n=1 Tax=Elsinoe australis TaxID=40998 RepID=A0A4V6DTD7_9PEZI|nr:hypothetical protein C1H76_7611 [Elsinoe australis]